MVKFEGKKDSLIAYFIFWGFAIALLLISGAANLGQWITVVFYMGLTVTALVILGLMPNDEKYYRNLNLGYFLAAIIVGLGMIGLSWGLSLQLRNTDMLMSINKSPITPLLGLQSTTLALTPVATSVATSYLSLLISGLVFAATAEEFLRLPAFAYGKDKWGKNGYKIGNLTIPAVFIYVGAPVGFWAGLHAIQAYQNPIMVLPAFVNGIVLTIYLWKTQCILGAVFCHYVYNLGITTIAYINGSSGLNPSLPLLPLSISNLPLFVICALLILIGVVFLIGKKDKGKLGYLGAITAIVLGTVVLFKWAITFINGYFSNSGFIVDLLYIALAFMSIFMFLFPSLTGKKTSAKR